MEQNRKKKIAGVVVIVLWVLLVVILVGVSVFIIQIKKFFTNDYDAVTEILSPRGDYTLVAKEFTFLLGGRTDLFIQKDGQTEQIGSLGADEAGRPFRDGRYRIEWGETEITVRYFSGVPAEKESDETTWSTRTFALPGSVSPESRSPVQ